jgi:hypothetical protein
VQRAFWLVLLVGLASACEQVDVVVRHVPAAGDAAPAPTMDAAVEDSATDAGPVADADAGGDAATDAGADTDTGMPIDPRCPYRSAPPPTGSASSVAEQVTAGLDRAVCTCIGYVGGALTVDAATDGASGDVASDGAFDLQLTSMVAGALTIAGDDGISLGSGVTLEVGGDLSVNGPLEGAEASVRVGADAAVAARIDLVDLTVGGTLTQTPGEPLLVANPPMIGDMRSEAVQVAPSCGCEPATLLDIATLVRARAPLAEPLPEGPLPDERCAQYGLDGGTVDALSLDASASAAIWVTGDLALDTLAIAVADGAELDVFLEGNLLVTGELVLGSATSGGTVRLHVGGTGTIGLPQGGLLRGALYAPTAELVLSGPLTVHGAIFVKRLAADDNSVVVHHLPQSAVP